MDIDRIPDDQLDELLKELETVGMCSTKEWNPYEKQRKFHLSPKRIKVILGGNRSGKTECGNAEALMHATGLYPDWYPENLKIPVPNVGRIIVTDFAKGFGETILPKIEKWLPSGMVKQVKKNHEGYPSKFILHNGSSFDVCTHEQADTVFEGWSGHWAWFDEPPPRSKYIATMRGLVDFNGRCWLTMTPLSEPWIWDELVKRQDDTVFVIQVNTRDNPFLPPTAVDEFESQLTDEEKSARIQGNFLHLHGLVYKDFDRNVHIKALNLEDKKSVYASTPKRWYFILDPHDRRDHCGMWAFITPDNKKYIAYQFKSGSNLTDLCAEILAFEKTKGIESWKVMRIGDPNKFKAPNPVTKQSLIQEFMNRNPNLYFNTDINDDIATGHMLVKEALKWDKSKAMERFNCPELYFNSLEHTGQVVFQMERYMYGDWKGVSKESKNPKETPRDLNKDFPDCIRYFLMSGAYFYPEYESKKGYTGVKSKTGYH